MLRALTLTAECGAGGGIIAQRVAEMLGWKLLDGGLVETVARSAALEEKTVARYDERVSSWWRRFHLAGLRALAILACAGETVLFDEEAVVTAMRREIETEAWRGRCVIVGRGAQCVLQDRDDAFHVLVYGPWEDRLSRVRSDPDPPQDAEEFVRSIDGERASYVRTYYGCDWKDPHLYDIMISSTMGVESAASLIVEAVKRELGTRRVSA